MYLVKLLIFIFVFGFNPTVSFAKEVYNADVRYLYVQKGQTLHNIVRRLYPERRKEWQYLTKEIVRLNPHAFIDNDPTKMKAGVRLKLPKKVVVRSHAAKPAKLKRVGTVAESSGSVVAVDKRKISRKLTRGNAVYLGDKVITGEKGSVRLKMIDDAVLDLRCFSIMVIEEYALNTTSRRSILNLLQGSLKKVTGQIGKMAEDVYELKTPVASVGVRGTEYALRVFQSKGCGGTIDADDGFYLEVIRGLVDVHNEAGREVIAKGETAYVPLPKAVPKKIKVKPGVIRPVVKTEVKEPEEESSSFWWWILGIVGIALLI
ncbi:MAG: hypothetical protein BMS9Abin19_0703 [Gammaproteobacteria bacterium]|nr:MAG: hypothetical protein BMS9Abin19_0703 [Gammaproteobacteria bacterium]